MPGPQTCGLGVRGKEQWPGWIVLSVLVHHFIYVSCSGELKYTLFGPSYTPGKELSRTLFQKLAERDNRKHPYRARKAGATP